MNRPDFSPAARTGNAIRLLRETADRRPDAPAVRSEDRELTYGELDDRSARFAGGLHDLGLDPGDRVAFFLPNRPAYLIAALGGLMAGTPPTPMNPQYRAREIAHQLDDAGASAVVTDAALRETLADGLDAADVSAPVVTVGQDEGDGGRVADDVPFSEIDGSPTMADRDGDDTAMQPYTSGTTGPPKGVLVTHDNLRTQAYDGFSFTDVPPDEERALVVLPLYHITGFVHCSFQTLVRGGTVHLRDPSDWDPETIMRAIEVERITGFIGVATMFVDMVNHDSFGEYDLGSLEMVNEGGAKMPVAVQERFEETAGVQLFEGYGLTETTGATHIGVGSTFGPKIGTVGQPVRMTDCRLVDEDGADVPTGETGELLVRGPQVMKGYHELPEENAAAFTDAGYFRTGDIARRDEENYYEIVDRKKHVINTAGYTVSPSEVEAVLYEHPGVAEAAVVGIPDERRGETVAAYIVQTGDADVSAEALRDYCLAEVAAYKHPREIAFVESLPRTASGKVQKFKLADRDD